MRSMVAAVLIAAALVLGIGAARAATIFRATCSAGGETWFGEERDTFSAARADADAHEQENPGHLAVVGEREAP